MLGRDVAAGEPARRAELSRVVLALSSARTTVVPTAITRPPRLRVAAIAAQVLAGTSKGSG